jgi:hypothetical protein
MQKPAFDENCPPGEGEKNRASDYCRVFVVGLLILAFGAGVALYGAHMAAEQAKAGVSAIATPAQFNSQLVLVGTFSGESDKENYEKLASELDGIGYRFATPDELMVYQSDEGELETIVPSSAGSFPHLAWCGNEWRSDGMRRLATHSSFSKSCKFLIVRKDAPKPISETASVAAKPPATQIWRTIKLGTHTVGQMKKAINPELISRWANDLLGKLTVAPTPTEVDLVKMSVYELGFARGTTTEPLFRRIKELGELCPAEVGLQLRIQYRGDETIFVAMEPITGSADAPGVFALRCAHDGLWLGADYAGPDDFWAPGNRLVFVPPRK